MRRPVRSASILPAMGLARAAPALAADRPLGGNVCLLVARYLPKGYPVVMLSALLPGVREFRTPMVTGLLWAACLWLPVGAQVAGSRATAEFIGKFRLHMLPSTVWLAVMALTIYLIGSLLVVRTSPFRWLSKRRWRFSRIGRWEEDRAEYRRLHLVSSGVPVFHSLDSWLRNEFQGLAADGLVPVMRGYVPGEQGRPGGFEAFYSTDSVVAVGEDLQNLYYRFSQQVKMEESAIEVRIQMRFPDVYSEIDRLKVESDLRMSIFWPLGALCVLLVFAWSPFCVVGLIVPPLLLRDGFSRSREASNKTWGTLEAGEVSSPTLDAMANAKDSEPRDFGARRT